MNGSIAAGLKYNSNVDHLYLDDRLLLTQTQKDVPKLAAFFVSTEGDIGVTFGKENNFSLDYSLYSDYAPTYPEYSRFSHSGGFSMNQKISNHYYFNASLLSRHYIEHYRDFRNLYVDVYGAFNLFYDHNEYLSAYVDVKAGYYHSFDKRLVYVNGEAGGLEIGSFIYPTGDIHFFKISVGSEYFNFDDEEIHLIRDGIEQDVLFVHNQYVKTFGQLEGEYYIGDLVFSGAARYMFYYTFNKDYKVEETWKKRRKEHTVTLNPAIMYRVTDAMLLTLHYSFKINSSSIGKDAPDYTDYSRIQHIGGINFVYNFSGGQS